MFPTAAVIVFSGREIHMCELGYVHLTYGTDILRVTFIFFIFENRTWLLGTKKSLLHSYPVHWGPRWFRESLGNCPPLSGLRPDGLHAQMLILEPLCRLTLSPGQKALSHIGTDAEVHRHTTSEHVVFFWSLWRFLISSKQSDDINNHCIRRYSGLFVFDNCMCTAAWYLHAFQLNIRTNYNTIGCVWHYVN